MDNYIVDLLDVAVVAIDANFQVTTFNKKAVKVFNIHAEDAINQNVENLLNFPPGNVLYLQRTLEEQKDLTLDETEDNFGSYEQPLKIDTKLIRNSGQKIIGAMIVFTDVINDVTKRKLNQNNLNNESDISDNSEQAFKDANDLKRDLLQQQKYNLKIEQENKLKDVLLENLNIGLVLEEDGKIAVLNRFFCEIIGESDDCSEMVGEDRSYFLNKLKGLVNVDEYNEQEEAPIKADTVKGALIKEEIELVDGRFFERVIIPIYENWKLKYRLWILLDITDRKRFESKLSIEKEKVEKANNAKSVFLLQMSHELRTPLNSILGYAQLIESSTEIPVSSKPYNWVKKQIVASHHFIAMINEILDFSKIESNKEILTICKTDLYSLINQCIEVVQPFAEQFDITVKFQCNEEDFNNHSHIMTDKNKLTQIIINLLTNGIKYNRDCGYVNVECELEDKHVKLLFIDNGKGITEEHLVDIFEPFYRVEGATAEREGIGIGLALVKEYVLMMNGEYGVTSKIGQGSVFWVKFPFLEKDQNLGV
ncbi:ATP-binding protein [Bacillaceae bacterium IKA-2]|nr:ATP-binding protein [Bacillaceae bacterium IKA-2]